jgi:hypothetical protein
MHLVLIIPQIHSFWIMFQDCDGLKKGLLIYLVYLIVGPAEIHISCETIYKCGCGTEFSLWIAEYAIQEYS